MEHPRQVLIYGCYGYTGQLIVEEGQKRGLPMKLAGRDTQKVQDLAGRYNLPWVAFELHDQTAMDSALEGVVAVLHCSGPFFRTWEPMAKACIRNKVHYLDITGEIQVFEHLHSLHNEALGAGIQLMPGVGFDVVPTDCLAAWLKGQLPDAHVLDLVIFGIGAGTSRGTALTMWEGAGLPGMVRRNGRIVPDRLGAQTLKVDFGRGEKLAVSIPWGDVSTAYHSTGIPNITTYFVLPETAVRMMGIMNRMSWFFNWKWVKEFGRKRINAGKAGPTQHERSQSKTLIYGRVQNQHGVQKSKQIQTPNGYDFTASASVHIALQVVNGRFLPGFQTPSSAFGNQLLGSILGTDPFPEPR
jgi:short subunit dehydrogenase-like uncharacterized protein